MAAVIDLKGMMLRKKNTQRATPQLVLVVESRNLNVIRRLADMTGGNPEAKRLVDVKEWMRRGCTVHCPEAHVHVDDKHMPVTQRWTVTGVAAGIVLHNLAPYLVADKPYQEFLDMAIENSAMFGQGSGLVRSTVTRLVVLGWGLPPKLASDLVEIARIAEQAAKAVSA
jgi:hypothetical protein